MIILEIFPHVRSQSVRLCILNHGLNVLKYYLVLVGAVIFTVYKSHLQLPSGL